MNWTQAPGFAAAFLASLVECVEAATILLAVGMVRGWRSALLGAGAALLLLAALVVVLGPAIAALPERGLQLAVGLLLLLFGMRWLRKAMLRMAGAIPLHDEDAVFRSEAANLRLARASARWGLDPIAAASAGKAVLLEGLEVVFIVLALAAGSPARLAAASAGAALAALMIAAIAAALHRPLARVPENTLKFAVGVLISAFGIFWTGEGLGLAWPGGDLALLPLVAALAAVGLGGARLAMAEAR